MDEILFSKVDLMWHCNHNDYPSDPFAKVYLVLKVTDTDSGVMHCVVHDNATYNSDTGKWAISYCDFESKGRDDDGEWQVLAWAYKPAMNEVVSANLWQQLLEAKEDSDVRITD